MDELSVLAGGGARHRGSIHGNEQDRVAARVSGGAAPARQRGGADAVRGADALAQGRVDLAEGGSLRPLLLPAVQHQLMEVRRAVDRGREPETIFNGLDYLRRRRKANHQLDSEVRICCLR